MVMDEGRKREGVGLWDEQGLPIRALSRVTFQQRAHLGSTFALGRRRQSASWIMNAGNVLMRRRDAA